MPVHRKFILGGVLMLVGMGAGCGKSDQWPRVPVTGQVTLDDQPLGTGQLTFFPIEGTRGPAAGAEIRDGVFSLAKHEGPVVGKHRVEIRSVQKTGRQVPSPSAVEGDGVFAEGTMVEEYADIVPKRYNTYSELVWEIREGEPNEATFPLSSTDTPPTSTR